MIRCYSDLRRLHSFEDRFSYLSLPGEVGQPTFGFDRWINQNFYTSREWRRVRNHVIARDNGCDLGVDGFEIYGNLLVHHMNPILPEDITNRADSILNPEFLITTTQRTHNAIHFGDERLLRKPYVERRPGDTRPW